MTSSWIRRSISRAATAAASIVAGVTWANAALASQGPGGGMGTAGHLTQVAMAILVTAFSLFTDALRDALDPKVK